VHSRIVYSLPEQLLALPNDYMWDKPSTHPSVDLNNVECSVQWSGTDFNWFDSMGVSHGRTGGSNCNPSMLGATTPQKPCTNQDAIPFSEIPAQVVPASQAVEPLMPVVQPSPANAATAHVATYSSPETEPGIRELTETVSLATQTANQSNALCFSQNSPTFDAPPEAGKFWALIYPLIRIVNLGFPEWMEMDYSESRTLEHLPLLKGLIQEVPDLHVHCKKPRSQRCGKCLSKRVQCASVYYLIKGERPRECG
jgi:hypothetical protein